MTTPSRCVMYHNPHCSKSRQTLSLLRQHGVEPELLAYLDTPPSAAQLTEVLQQLALGPRAVLRQEEAEYRTLGLDRPDLDDATLIAAMVAHPRLIQRPIVLKDGRAVLGRPPEAVLELL